MEEYEFTDEFLQARVDELVEMAERRGTSLTAVIQLIRRGQSGEEIEYPESEIYGEGLRLLGDSLRFRENAGALLDAIDQFVS